MYELLKEAGITPVPQGSSIKEIHEALKTASKSGTGNIGYPEYTIELINDRIKAMQVNCC